MKILEELESLYSSLDPQMKMVLNVILVFTFLLIILVLRNIRKGRREKSQPEKIDPLKAEIDFSIEGLERFNLDVSEPSELAIVEKDVDSEDKTESNYETLYKNLKIKYKNLETRYMNLEIAFSSLKGRVDHWKQRCLRAEEINEGYGSDVSAIYKSKGDIKVSALEYLLAIVADTNSIDQGIRTINKPPYPKSLQIGSTVVGLAIVAFFWLNKEAWNQLMQIINTPRNQIFIVVTLIAIAGITYYYRRKR